MKDLSVRPSSCPKLWPLPWAGWDLGKAEERMSDVVDQHEVSDMIGADAWNYAIGCAISAIRALGILATIRFLTSDELFVHDDRGYSIVSSMISIFDIFPWFHYPNAITVEDLHPHESIEIVTQSLNGIRQTQFQDNDYALLTDFYRQMPLPSRPLWTITCVYTFIRNNLFHPTGQVMFFSS